jgi:hypothetical protein
VSYAYGLGGGINTEFWWGNILEKEPLGGRRRRWDSLRHLKEMRFEDGKWMELTQDRVHRRELILAALNFRVLLSAC